MTKSIVLAGSEFHIREHRQIFADPQPELKSSKIGGLLFLKLFLLTILSASTI